MKKFFKILLWIIIVLAATVLIGAAFMPSKIEVSVTKEMKADKKVIFDYVNNLKANSAWSPWEGVDEIKYGEISKGKGATMSWTDEMSGSGKQVISESKPYSMIKTELDFGEQGMAKADFLFEDMEKGTKVTWSFESDAPYPMGRWFSALFIKPMIQKSYEKGLHKLDSVASIPHKMNYVDVLEVKSPPILSITVKSKTENIAKNMEEIFAKLGTYMGKNQITPTAPPLTIWHSWSKEESEMEVGFPVSPETKGNDKIKLSKTYEGKVAVYLHKGSYDKSPKSWEKLMKAVKKMNLEPNGSPYEIYITNPQMESDTSKWQTKLFMPVK